MGNQKPSIRWTFLLPLVFHHAMSEFRVGDFESGGAFFHVSDTVRSITCTDTLYAETDVERSCTRVVNERTPWNGTRDIGWYPDYNVYEIEPVELMSYFLTCDSRQASSCFAVLTYDLTLVKSAESSYLCNLTFTSDGEVDFRHPTRLIWKKNGYVLEEESKNLTKDSFINTTSPEGYPVYAYSSSITISKLRHTAKSVFEIHGFEFKQRMSYN